MSRRLSTLLVAAVPTALLILLGLTVQVPLVAMGPGPTYDTLGVVGGDGGADGLASDTPVIVVRGRDADPTTGRLDMTTVAVRDHLTILDAARYWVDRDQTVVPRDQVFAPDQTPEQVKTENQQQMAGSESSAQLAAYRQLQIPLAPRVHSVDSGGAAAGRLREGDLITAVDGRSVSTTTEVVTDVGSHEAGETVRIDYRRDDRPGTARVELRAGEPGPGSATGKGRLGVMLADSPADGTEVTVTLDPNVGGPSAGLMFALGIVDKLSPGELTGGRTIAGTGTIDPGGDVGPIGGVRHKIVAARAAGATDFLVPKRNCTEATADPPEGIRLVEVETLDGAVQALHTIADGGAPPACG